MADDVTARVRSFNRTVSERIGALADEYLARGRPLGASRVLWESGAEPTDLRALRARLGLDSGYLSRLVRSLQREGLVRLDADPADRRVRTVRLTDAGRAERELLDRASDDLARSLLAPLGEAQRARLVEAMGVVERLLTAGLVEIDAEDARGAGARACLAAYFAELDARFEDGFDPGRSLAEEAAELAAPRGLVLLARLRGEPVACGGLHFEDDGFAEVKRLWVSDAVRGLGVGRRLLGALEERARERGIGTLRLDTNRALPEAAGLYRSAGYREIDRYNDNPYAHHFFCKRLDGAPR
jgi:DNA-binding MarR family transcriptional regulator/GNAT superfamily N-acetyltransferase